MILGNNDSRGFPPTTLREDAFPVDESFLEEVCAPQMKKFSKNTRAICLSSVALIVELTCGIFASIGIAGKVDKQILASSIISSSFTTLVFASAAYCLTKVSIRATNIRQCSIVGQSCIRAIPLVAGVFTLQGSLSGHDLGIITLTSVVVSNIFACCSCIIGSCIEFSTETLPALYTQLGDDDLRYTYSSDSYSD